MERFVKSANELFGFTQELRRDFHMHPELGLEETRTAGIVAEKLKSFGLEVETGIAKTGVVGLLKGGNPGPTILLRADMDALPVSEENDVPYASKTAGKMHACGHDAHTAMMLTVARILSGIKDELHGSIKFVFQPAEEGGGGAEMMVQEGVLKNPKPELSLGMHVWNASPTGTIVLKKGPLMAGAKSIEVVVTGKGGHGAMPYQTVDPVMAAAQILTALQTIISRNVNTQDTAVLSMASVQAGDAFNVVPSTAVIKGTMRFFQKDVEKLIETRFEEIVTHTAKAMGCEAEIFFTDVAPAVINEESIIDTLIEITREILPEITIDPETTTMGSEDFAYMMDEIPGAYYFIGTANEAEGKNFPHHHPRFDIDEAALPAGTALMCAAAYKYLQLKK